FIRDDQGSTVERGLTTVPSGSSWIDGKFLQYKGKLSPGKYTFRFAAHDGEFAATGDVDWHPETVNVTPRNQVPQLSQPEASPREGDTDTVFRFDVLYRDGDNQEPSSAQIYLDGTPYTMDTEVTSGPWTDWVTFYYETTLDVGDNHRYYFLFSDGEDQARLPLASASPNWLPGPVVEPPNYEPVLTSQRFTPLSGDRDTEFTFYVTYTDGENDRPVTSFLFLDGTPYVMNPDGNDYVSGVTFSYTTRLDVGPHEFHFTFSDGEHTVRLPDSGELDGPDVSNRAPTAVISSPADDTRFEPDDYVSFASAGSDDPDGDPLEFTWTSDLDGVLGTGQAFDVQLSEGEHLVTLSVSDPYGGTHESTVTVLVKPYLPHLFIVAIETNVDRPVEGDAVRITATISNDGEAKAQGVTVTISVDGFDLVLDTLSVDVEAVRTTSATWTAVPGTHTAVVEVGGDTDSIDIEVAANDPPVITMELVNTDPKLKPGQEVYFKATVTDANGDPVAYEWD
ncbi:MAG: hypothetical protein GWN18_10445, partial [Thermoplasmata archaeon]|nr:hypothetical protein [Thermoplasmata archaeon]NIS12467.1 hypothetical protein [Thermoplasmata archaeon]NIS20385.1 hypothetical protein [Thermoplasmata archaeon]NIT77731.1 hypothetical protein [Thermoplasmata archaeon]NIU49472.1 hypothetical protein [Thermoplasmata archaeon]